MKPFLMPGMRRTGISLAISTLFAVAPAIADPVAEPPDNWAQRVQPVPEVDVSGADVAARQVLRDTRDDLARLLADPATPPKVLGDGYGRLGAHYQNSSVPGAAEQAYLNAAVLSPDDVHWTYYLADLLLENGRPGEALALLDRARELAPDYRPLDLQRGRALYELNRLDEAQVLLEGVAGEAGLAPRAAFYLGQIALMRRDYSAAAGYFERTLELDPEAERAHYPLAQALRALGDATRAQAELARHGNRMPLLNDPLLDERKALRTGARPHFERAMAAVHRHDYAAAAKAFADGLAMAPDNLHARLSYARALYLSGQGSEARAQLAQALEAEPGHPLASFLAALLHQQDGDQMAAANLYRRTLAQASGHAGAHYFLAGLAFRSGDFAAAAKHYGAAVAANPEIADGAVLQLVAMRRAGVEDRALAKRLDALLASRPDDPLAGYAAARLRLLSADPEVRDPELSLSLAERLTARMPTPPNLQLLALAYGANGRREEAAELIRQLGATPPWMAPVDTGRLEQQVQSLAEGDLLLSAWPDDDPLLRPPPFQPDGPMREYPAAVPF
jgi:predicted Zn-dependent protease